MDLKTFDGLIAEQFQTVAALDQRDAFGRQALEFDRSYFRAILLALALALRLLVAVEFTFNPISGTMEQVDRRPEQILKIRFKPGIAESSHQGVEDIGDSTSDHLALGKRSRVRLVVVWTVAEKLQFTEDVVSWR